MTDDILPRFQWRIMIAEGDEIPHGYGIAYYEADRDAAVCMPLPLNAIVGLWRALRWHLMCPPWRRVERKAYLAIYARGYERGFQDARFGRVYSSRPQNTDADAHVSYTHYVSQLLR